MTGLRHRIAVGLTMAAVLAGCSGSPPTASSQTVKAGDSVDLAMNGVHVRGSAGAVGTPGTITLSRAQAKPDIPGFTPAAEGIEVSLGGATLTKPLALEVIGTAATSDELEPVMLHQAVGGHWLLEPAVYSKGAFRSSANEFSLRVPGWLNPTTYLSKLFHSVANGIAGRTDPPPCAGGPPSWATLNKTTDYLHACLASAGSAARLELAVNRRQLVQIEYPSDVTLKHIAGVDSLLARLIQNGLSLPPSVAILGEGDRVALEVDQPRQSRTLTFMPSITIQTAAYSLILTTMGIASDVSDDVGKRVTAAMALKACADKMPSHIKDTKGFGTLMSCVFVEVMSQLRDPSFARRQAIAMLDGELSNSELTSFSIKVSKVAKGLEVFGRAMKVLALVQANVAIYQSLLDSIQQAFAPNGTVELDLRPPKGQNLIDVTGNSSRGVLFASPSGNLVCFTMAALNGVGCQGGYSDGSNSHAYCQIPGDAFGIAGVLVAEKSGWLCGGGLVGGGDGTWATGYGFPSVTAVGVKGVSVLPYGWSLRLGSITCDSTTNGMQCVNHETAAGFLTNQTATSLTGPQYATSPTAAAVTASPAVGCTTTFPGSPTQHAVDLEGTTITCGDAKQLIAKYLGTPDPNGGNLAVTNVDGWTCLAPTATMAATEDTAVRCTRGNETVTVRP